MADAPVFLRAVMMGLFLVLVTATSLLLVGCSAFDLINATTGRAAYTVERDIAYGSGERQRYDRYVPLAVGDGAPAIVFLYGGSWSSGDKEDYLFAAAAFASRGHITYVPNYRVYPDVVFPGFVEDAAAAVAEAARREGRAVVLVGHSAGAHIAALLTLDEHYLAKVGAPVCETLVATVGLAGPYDFLPLQEERYRQIFPEATRAASQPIAFVNGTEPPMLLLSGASDRTVRPANSARLAALIRERGGRAELKLYEGIGHIRLIGALSEPFRKSASVLDDIVTFINGQVARSEPPCR